MGSVILRVSSMSLRERIKKLEFGIFFFFPKVCRGMIIWQGKILTLFYLVENTLLTREKQPFHFSLLYISPK